MRRDRVLDAHQHRSLTVLFGMLVLIVCSAWCAWHAMHSIDLHGATGNHLAVVWLLMFVMLMAQTVFYHLERPHKLTDRLQRQLNGLHVAILMPVFNEDPGYLKLGLQSMLQQSRRPNSVHIVDDGSGERDRDGNITKIIDYADVRDWWIQAAALAGIDTTWQRVPNAGKRHAQAHGVHMSPNADVYVTVDSDSYLAPDAIRQILAPFARRKVQSVAGIVISTNNHGPARPDVATIHADGHKRPSPTVRLQRKAQRGQQIVNWRGRQLLARVTDLWFTSSQLVDRSALSAMGSVLVNSGPLAAYRAEIVRDNLDSYLNETFLGRPVGFSDDSLLTLYALLRGRTVQQPSAVVFSALPERPGHFIRMYLRWMRGSTIRSVWRFRYLPLNSFAYWAHFFRWFQVAVSSSVLVWLMAIEPTMYHNAPPKSFMVIPLLIGWAQGLRYLTVIRTDERIRTRVLTWLLMPVAVLAAWTVLRWLRWYGAATCAKTGWGTRQSGAEVSLDSQELVAA